MYLAVRGSLTLVGQHDWFAVTLTAGQAYEITETGLSQYAGVEIATAADLASDGTTAYMTSYGGVEPVEGSTLSGYFMPSSSGTYYIDVSDAYATVPTNFTVSLTTTTADYTDNPSDPGTVAVGGDATGTLTNVGQHDWFAVTLTANQAYVIAEIGAAGDVEIGTAAELASDGTSAPFYQVGPAAGSDHINTYFMPSTSGTYYIDVSDTGASGPADFTVYVATTTSEYTDNPTDPDTLSVGGEATGSFTIVGQHDWFAVTLTANQAYEFSVVGVSSAASVVIATAADLAGDGSLASLGSNGGGVPDVTLLGYFMPSSSGTYYIDVADPAASFGSTFTVSIGTTTADYTDNPGDPGSLTVGGEASGTLTNYGQHDWFAVALTANQAYEFSETGLTEDANVEIATAAELAGDGTEGSAAYPENDSGFTPTTVSGYFMPSSSGTYYVDVSDLTAPLPASFTVSIGTTTADYTDNPSNPGIVSVGGEASGTLTNFGQHDWFAVTLTANQAYVITETGFPGGSGNLEIANAADLASEGTSANASVERYALTGPSGSLTTYFMPSASGTYYIDVSDESAALPTSFTVSVATTTAAYTDNPSNPATLVAPATNDFYGSGTSALLWQNSTTDQVAVWQINDGSAESYTTIGTEPSGWQAVGAGDFYASGQSAILWQNLASGQVAIWQMNGATPTAYDMFATFPSGWQIAGIGDFFGNDNADILWRNPSTGQNAIWQMNGSSVVGYDMIAPQSSDWEVGGVADFNGDGYADILWENTSTNQIEVWEMQGSSVLAANVVADTQSGWTVAGVGDFSGNGTESVLFQNTTTDQVAIMQTNGAANSVSTAVVANNVPFGSGWQIAAIGDYYGNGTDDILWQNASAGETAIWQMNGLSTPTYGPIVSGIPAGWQPAHQPVLAA